jgi:hypothetical protein
VPEAVVRQLQQPAPCLRTNLAAPLLVFLLDTSAVQSNRPPSVCAVCRCAV